MVRLSKGRCWAVRLVALVAVMTAPLGAGGQVWSVQDSPREIRDRADMKKNAFIARLPLVTHCKAQVAAGVLRPEGQASWSAGEFEVEPQDHFVFSVFLRAQLPESDRPSCESQAEALVPSSVERNRRFDDGSLLCVKRVYQDAARLPQTLACELRFLLTQPTHLRCKNLDPILDPDGIFVSPNLMMVMTLPQAVMTQGLCSSSPR
ncbi:MAG: hypothetical protein FJY35_00395 [Betaproteobacteria bacterium]|nr:hypothetical protein [Betaproteobacteria bacterium]